MRRRESAADVCVPQLHTPLAKLWQSPKHARQNAAARLSPMSKKGMFARKGAVVKTVYSFGQRGESSQFSKLLHTVATRLAVRQAQCDRHATGGRGGRGLTPASPAPGASGAT